MSVAYKLLEFPLGMVMETPVQVPIRWRSITSTSITLTGSSAVVICAPGTTPMRPGCGVTAGTWNIGGVASIGRYACRYQNGSAYLFRRSTAVVEVPKSGHVGTTPALISSSHAYVTTDTNIQVDMTETLATLRATYPSDEYTVVAYALTNIAGEPMDINVNNDLLGLYALDSYYAVNVPGAVNLYNFRTDNIYKTETVQTGDRYDPTPLDVQLVSEPIIEGVTDDAEGAAFATTVKNLGENLCAGNSASVPMYMRIWVSKKAAVEELKVDPVPEEPRQPVSIGSNGGTGAGSGDEGQNTFTSNYGNSNIPFNSIYLTGSNYNSFVSAGGGIVGDSGVFPQSDTLYIDTVRMSLEGSTMTIVEAVKFDASPSLTLGERVYGYIFDDSHKSMPVFCGYVTSRKRRLSGESQEIVYECRDFIYYLDQLYSPSHYIYRPPSYTGSGVTKTYDRVLKEILNVAGVSNAIVDLPTYTAPPTNWIYQPLRDVIGWVTKFFGNYTYFVDRFGRLNIRGLNSGSHIKNYTIPAEGVSVSDSYNVMDFQPIADFSRSRSRIVLTGDFEVTEKKLTAYFRRGGELNPSACETTGIYWFKETIDGDVYDDEDGKEHKFYYFMFKPGETLNSKLLTDKTQSCRVTILNYKDKDGNVEDKIVSPRVMKTEPGDSEIYVEGSDFKQSRKIEIIYAVKTNSPIQVHSDTGLSGGTEVVRRPEFKKLNSLKGSINDKPLMSQYISKLRDFFKPIYGGSLTLDGLDLDLQLLGKVNILGTDLSAIETTDLVVYGITWDNVSKKTSVDLSNKTYMTLPFFSVVRERSRANNESLAKMGMLEESELYGRG